MDKFYILLLLCGAGICCVNAKLNLCLHLKNNDDRLLPGLQSDHIVLPNYTLFLNHSAIILTIDFTNLYLWNVTYIKPTILTHKQLFNLTFPSMSFIADNYKMHGNVGGLFDIFGDGDFECHLHDFSVSFSIVEIYLNKTDFCVPVSLDVDLHGSDIRFGNIMNDQDLEGLINKAFSTLIPEIVVGIWEEIKEHNDPAIEKGLNDLINSIFGANPKLRDVLDDFLKNNHIIGE